MHRFIFKSKINYLEDDNIYRKLYKEVESLWAIEFDPESNYALNRHYHFLIIVDKVEDELAFRLKYA